jgi:hypothetical protein
MGLLEGLPWVIQHGQYTGLQAALVSLCESSSHTKFKLSTWALFRYYKHMLSGSACVQ